jgi:hypothetical protein
VTGVTPSAIHVGSIVQGIRLASAQGRDITAQDDDGDTFKKVNFSCFVKRNSLAFFYF